MPKLSLAFPGQTAASPGVIRRPDQFSALQNGFKRFAQVRAALMGKALANWGTVAARWSESGDARAARRQQDYLAQAGDRYDLEYRIRELDRNDRLHSNYR